MEKRDYDLELIRMEFMDGVSQIATEAWESQKPAALEINLGQVTEEQRKQRYKYMDDMVLLTQRWWVEKQSEFVSKLIADYKSNIFFRQIAQNCENDLYKINENLKNAEKMTTLSNGLIKNKPHQAAITPDSKLDNKFNVLYDLLNRVFRDYKDTAYVAGEEYISGFAFSIKVGLLDDLLTAYLSGHYARSENIIDKYLPGKYKYNMSFSYFSFLPMHFISGADTHPKLDLTYFTKYFECYCKFITKLLRIKERIADKNVFDKNMSYQDFVKTIPMEELNDNTIFDKNMSYQNFVKAMDDKMGGRKKTRKHKKRMFGRKKNVSSQ
jgi:hypothetical protein